MGWQSVTPSTNIYKECEVKTANKYKPTNLGEVIYPSEAVRIRIQAYMSGNLEGNLLLWGPNGTGKTSVADLLPAYINNGDAPVDTNYDAILKKDDLNGYIANSCSIAEWGGHKKHFMVFHEFDNAEDDVNELWTAMDKYSDKLMVIITTNNPMSVHQSLRSRCDEVHFPALTARQVLRRSQSILNQEGLSLLDAQVLHYLEQIEHFGDLRKYFAKLDEILLLSRMGAILPPVPAIASKPRVKFSVV
jgi:DNA polymerase III delta prime subunit